MVTSKSSHASTKRERAGKADVEKRDQTCCVSGQPPSRCKAAHVVERFLAENLGVPTDEIDDASNRILLLGALEDTYGHDEWCFDEDGNVKILFAHTLVKRVLEAANFKIRLVPENRGGPKRDFIKKAYTHKIRMAAKRCPNCFQVRPDLDKHRKTSCQGVYLFPQASSSSSSSSSAPSSSDSKSAEVKLDAPRPRLPSMVCKRVIFSVQSAAFREHVRKQANAFGITGWVKNVSPGKVEMVAQGVEIDLFIAACNENFQVANVTIADAELDPQRSSFAIFGR